MLSLQILRTAVPGRARCWNAATSIASSERTVFPVVVGNGPALRRGRAQDVRCEKYGLVVELNGRSIHDNPESWDADARRRLAELAVSGALTVPVTYGLAGLP